MIEKWKENLKNNFSNSPKAKIMVSVIGVLIIALTITFTCVREKHSNNYRRKRRNIYNISKGLLKMYLKRMR